MNNIGIMQGRLTKPNNRGIQFFPFENWENEFHTAARLQLDEIEFIFDYEGYEDNPLFSSSGIKKIKEIIKSTGVKVNSICFDYFMRRPFYKFDDDGVRAENKEITLRIIDSLKEIGGRMLDIPLVDNSSIKTEEECGRCIEFFRELSSLSDIILNIETDFPAVRVAKFLKEANLPNLSIEYDTGDSAGLGYNLYEEVTLLKESITNIHIKDKKLGGATIPLGMGNADFDALFKGLRGIQYEGSFILQVARGEEGSEIATVKEQILFLKGYINKYLMEHTQ